MILAPPLPNLFYLNHLITSFDMGCGISRASLSAAVLSRGRSFDGSGEFSSASATAADGGRSGGGGSFKNNNNKTGELESGDSWVWKENIEFVDQRSPLFLKEQRMEGEFLDWKRVDCKSIKKDEREWENRVIWSNVEDQNRDDREDSIWVCPGSPSFRVYCVDNDLLVHPTHQSTDDSAEEEKENRPVNPMKEHSKELGQAHRRGRIGRGFKTIRRCGSNGMRHLLNVSCRISSPNSHHHANAKPVVMEESIN